MENYKLEKLLKIFKTINKNKSLFSIDNIDINKIIISNQVFFGKKDFKYFICYKEAEKIDLYAYSFQKWLHIEEILIKLNVCFFDEKWKLLKKYIEVWKRVSNIIKKGFHSKPV